jgi:hypothetical protein
LITTPDLSLQGLGKRRMGPANFDELRDARKILDQFRRNLVRSMRTRSPGKPSVEILIEKRPSPNSSMRRQWIHAGIHIHGPIDVVVVLLEVRSHNVCNPDPFRRIPSNPRYECNPRPITVGESAPDDVYTLSGGHTCGANH